MRGPARARHSGHFRGWLAARSTRLLAEHLGLPGRVRWGREVAPHQQPPQQPNRTHALQQDNTIAMLGMKDVYMGVDHTEDGALRSYEVDGGGAGWKGKFALTNRSNPILYIALPEAVLKTGEKEAKGYEAGYNVCKHVVVPKAPLVLQNTADVYIVRYFGNDLYAWSPKHQSWGKAIAQYQDDNGKASGEITCVAVLS